MPIRPIRNEKDYRAVLGEIEDLWGAEIGTQKGDRLEVLTVLAEAYERAKFPIDLPDPIDAIRFRLEQRGEDVKALVGIMGSRTRVYEVLRGDRPLSLKMIRELHNHLGIPADILIQQPRKSRRKAA
jgi:HTH-type transcriptional regulator/antitoxin HigA